MLLPFPPYWLPIPPLPILSNILISIPIAHHYKTHTIGWIVCRCAVLRWLMESGQCVDDCCAILFRLRVGRAAALARWRECRYRSVYISCWWWLWRWCGTTDGLRCHCRALANCRSDCQSSVASVLADTSTCRYEHLLLSRTLWSIPVWVTASQHTGAGPALLWPPKARPLYFTAVILILISSV